MTKKEIKTAISVGLFWSVFVIGFFYLIDKMYLTSAFMYLVFGQMFGFGIIFFSKLYADKVVELIKIEIPEDEVLIKEGKASHFRGIEAAGGKLLLTDKKLYFKPHKLNIQNHSLIIELPNIESIKRVRTAKVINNGIKIKLNNSVHHQFVVDNAKSWFEVLT